MDETAATRAEYSTGSPVDDFEFRPKTNSLDAAVMVLLSIWVIVSASRRPLGWSMPFSAALVIVATVVAVRSLHRFVAATSSGVVISNVWAKHHVPWHNALGVERGRTVKLLRADGRPVRIEALRRRLWIPEEVRGSAVDLLEQRIRIALKERDSFA